MALSDFALKSAKPRERLYRLSDGDGLFLLVRPNGSKLWQLRYRFMEKEDVLSFGKYPHVALTDARRKRDDAKRLLVAGTNPAAQRRQEGIAAVTAARTTFGLIADEFIERMGANEAADATVVKKRWLLENLANRSRNAPSKRSLRLKCSISCNVSRRAAGARRLAACAVHCPVRASWPFHSGRRRPDLSTPPDATAIPADCWSERGPTCGSGRSPNRDD